MLSVCSRVNECIFLRIQSRTYHATHIPRTRDVFLTVAQHDKFELLAYNEWAGFRVNSLLGAAGGGLMKGPLTRGPSAGLSCQLYKILYIYISPPDVKRWFRNILSVGFQRRFLWLLPQVEAVVGERARDDDDEKNVVVACLRPI